MAIEAFRSDEPDDLDSDAGGWGVCEGVIVKLNFELYKSLFFSSNVYKFVWTITGCHGISIKEPCVGSLTSVVGNGLMSRLNCVNPDVLLCCEALWRCHFDLKYSVNILVDHLKKTCWNIFQQINLHIYIYIYLYLEMQTKARTSDSQFAIITIKKRRTWRWVFCSSKIMETSWTSKGTVPPMRPCFLGFAGYPWIFHENTNIQLVPTCIIQLVIHMKRWTPTSS